MYVSVYGLDTNYDSTNDGYGNLVITVGTSDYITMTNITGQYQFDFVGTSGGYLVDSVYIVPSLYTYSNIVTLSAGTYTLVAKASASNGGTCKLTGHNIGYLLLGS